MGILSSIGTWLLKILLQGVFGKVLSDVENSAETEKQAALLQAQTTRDAAGVEVDIIKAQYEARDKARDQKPSADDPFNADKWNGAQ